MAENLNHYRNLVKYQQEFIATKLEEDKVNNSIERLERRVLALSKSVDWTRSENSRLKRIVLKMERRLLKNTLKMR